MQETGQMTSAMVMAFLKLARGMHISPFHSPALSSFKYLLVGIRTRYEGEWVEGRKEGKGILYFQSGDTYTAVWKNGLASSGVYTFHPDSPWANPDF